MLGGIHDAQDPGHMSLDARVHVRIANATAAAPRDGPNDATARDQSTASVASAHAPSHFRHRADVLLRDEFTVRQRGVRHAGRIGHRSHRRPLQRLRKVTVSLDTQRKEMIRN